MRRIAIIGVALAAVLATSRAATGWVRGVGLDVWNWDAQVAELRAEQLLEGELLAEQAEQASRTAVIDDITARLVDGRLTLAEATGELERVTANHPDLVLGLRCAANHPDLVLGLRCAFPGATTDRDAHARWAIDRARCALRDDPSRPADATARLEAEYRAATSGAAGPSAAR